MTGSKFSSLIFLVYCLLSCPALFAQSKQSSKCGCGFGTINQGGVFVAGEMMPGGNLQSINGFRFKQWFAGVGAAIDFYRYRTIPVFFDIRRTVFNKPTAPFIYADFGVNYPWLRSFEKANYYKGQDFRTGYYIDFGVGYRFHIARQHHILLSAGYTEKRTMEDRTVPDWGCRDLPCPDKLDNFTYTMKRIIVKAGWAIW